MTKNLPAGKDHHMWKGDSVGYISLHQWIYRHKGKAEICKSCGSNRRVQWANISGEYKRDFNDFVELCSICHALWDRTIITESKTCLICKKSFNREKRRNTKWWKSVKFCGYKCAGISRRNKPRGYIYV